MNKIELLIIAGPTASGKTELALALTDYLPVEIISADSRQIYRFMDIGTAKPTEDELKRAPHHFINIKNPDEYYSAGMFERDADNAIQDIISRGKIPVVVGGSGLYIKALCEGFFHDDTPSDELLAIREQLEQELAEKGRLAIYQELSAVDPVSAQKYSDMNPRRIIRALSHYRLTGIPFSVSHHSQFVEKNYNCCYFAIDNPRIVLYEKINLRTVQMWNNGLLKETVQLLEMGYSENLNALNTVGYKETIQFIKGQLSEKDTISKIQQNTRHYAKRQLTWFRNQCPEIIWLNKNLTENTKFIVDFVKKKYLI
ncbi:MAG: tRNA (adenosine(37)-N6)-dimethylallyltransferase MiaA [Ignavibacteria bacterium]|nr:tRNA (adenosine(37)-N6)-dimethylallyltransferase MiaA [Ignavibacteria bacterium]